MADTPRSAFPTISPDASLRVTIGTLWTVIATMGFALIAATTLVIKVDAVAAGQEELHKNFEDVGKDMGELKRQVLVLQITTQSAAVKVYDPISSNSSSSRRSNP